MTTTAELSELTGDYILDTAHTRIGFVARLLMGIKVRGEFDEVNGIAHLDGDDPSKSSIELTIQAATIQTGNEQRDEHIRSKFLDTANHPTITFVSTKVQQVTDIDFKVTGDLAIRGVNVPVTVDLELIGAETDQWETVRVSFAGGVTLNRKHWGVDWKATMGTVSKTVILEFTVAAIRRA